MTSPAVSAAAALLIAPAVLKTPLMTAECTTAVAWWLSRGSEHPLGREVGGGQTGWTDASVGFRPAAVRCKGCARRRLGDRHDVVLPRPERLEVAPLRAHRPDRSVDLRK